MEHPKKLDKVIMPGHPWPHSRFVPRLLSHWFGGREQQTIDGRTVAVSRSSKPSNKRGENRCFFMNPYFSDRGIWKKRRLASQTNCCNSNLCPEIRHDYPPMQSRIAWTRKLLLLLVMRGGEGEKKTRKTLTGNYLHHSLLFGPFGISLAPLITNSWDITAAAESFWRQKSPYMLPAASPEAQQDT